MHDLGLCTVDRSTLSPGLASSTGVQLLQKSASKHEAILVVPVGCWRCVALLSRSDGHGSAGVRESDFTQLSVARDRLCGGKGAAYMCVFASLSTVSGLPQFTVQTHWKRTAE